MAIFNSYVSLEKGTPESTGASPALMLTPTSILVERAILTGGVEERKNNPCFMGASSIRAFLYRCLLTCWFNQRMGFNSLTLRASTIEKRDTVYSWDI